VAGRVPPSDITLRQFGYDLFKQPPTTFAPVTDVPVGPDYVIGAGDGLNIVLWGNVQEAYQVEVDRNGAITIPRLGVVQVWGFTVEQLQAFLRQRFAQFYPDFQMTVTLGKLRTILVYVVGEVRQPGAYTVSSLSTIINALFASGGPMKTGSMRRIRLMRSGRTIHTLDLYDFLLKGDKSQDQTLQSGDTIFVPVIGPVAGVAGNVRRPAIYEIVPQTTLQRLLELAGGVTPSGYLQRVHVERFVAHEKKIVVDIDLSSLPSARVSRQWQTSLQDGDVISVFPIVTTLENVVHLEGHVVRPGRYELKPGMRLRNLLPAYEALLPEPYLDYAEIVRFVQPDLHQVVVPFNVKALLAGETAHNLILQPQDRVRLFAKADFVDQPKATIQGEVRRPGVYLLLGEMRVKDLVARAGWLTKEAYLSRAEIIRVTANRDLQAMPLNLEAALRGHSADNLLLQDDDTVVIHNLFEQKYRQSARVSGLVNKPDAYPITEGMRISDLVFRAGGVQKLAYLEKAELTRHKISQGGDLIVRIEINLSQALAGDPEHNIPLEDFDHLLVRRISDIDLVDLNVEIQGEVLFPGTYPIQRGERLSSVLQRAGGFTQNAYLRGAVFTRESVRVAQENRLQELMREEEQLLLTASAAESEAALSAEEVQAQRQALVFRRDLLSRLRAVKPDGRVVVRLQPLEVFSRTAQDIEIEPGDRLVIPQTPKYVSIIGEVYNRTALIYEPGKDMSYYLEKVGGIKPTANEKEIALVQVDGTVFSNTQDRFLIVQADDSATYLGDFYAIRPQPGDTIVVPRQVETSATLRNFRDIVQIIFQSVSVIGVIVALL
jgi:protein involved in polysaccharide export with SLBB domain